jgi:hypothetical protein
MSLPAGAASPVALVAGAQDVVGIALDERAIYWTDVQDKSVSTAPRQ